MLLDFFKTKSVIDDSSRAWLFDCADWAINHFSASFFFQHTQLILPTNAFYPGRVSSIEQMAQTIFSQTVTYCGMEKWPLTLQPFSLQAQQPFPAVTVTDDFRGDNVQVFLPENCPQIIVGYNPVQVNQPQDMVATIVQQLSAILALSRKVLPPGGKDNLSQAVDLLATFLGFGVMFANTAYQFKGGCGSCYNPYANRQVALPENEALYGLAIFSFVKNLEVKSVSKHLKPHLRRTFAKMVKDVENTIGNDEQWQMMLATSARQNFLTK